MRKLFFFVFVFFLRSVTKCTFVFEGELVWKCSKTRTVLFSSTEEKKKLASYKRSILSTEIVSPIYFESLFFDLQVPLGEDNKQKQKSSVRDLTNFDYLRVCENEGPINFHTKRMHTSHKKTTFFSTSLPFFARIKK